MHNDDNALFAVCRSHVIAGVALAVIAAVGSGLLAQADRGTGWTLESATVSAGADVLSDRSIQVVGQPVAGVISNARFTIEVGQVPCLLAALKGDFDEDFDVDFADAATFVDVLVGIDTDALHTLEADMNGDGISNGADIDPFVQAMLGP